MGELSARSDPMVVWSNGYFTLTDNRNYDNCVMSVLPRWTQEGELGDKLKSKRIKVLLKDTTKENPRIAYLILGAWMIWKFQQSGFASHLPCRLTWLEAEREKLRRDIQALQVLGGGTAARVPTP